MSKPPAALEFGYSVAHRVAHRESTPSGNSSIAGGEFALLPQAFFTGRDQLASV
jgi:hypothetical protein